MYDKGILILEHIKSQFAVVFEHLGIAKYPIIIFEYLNEVDDGLTDGKTDFELLLFVGLYVKKELIHLFLLKVDLLALLFHLISLSF